MAKPFGGKAVPLLHIGCWSEPVKAAPLQACMLVEMEERERDTKRGVSREGFGAQANEGAREGQTKKSGRAQN